MYGKDCSDVHGCTNAAGAGMWRSGLQSYCISTIAPGRAGAAKHRTCESGRLDNCSCIVLPPDVPVGRLVVRRRTTAGQGLFLQSYCISTVPGGQKEDDCRDAGGRATQGAVAEVEARRRPTGMAEVRAMQE